MSSRLNLIFQVSIKGTVLIQLEEITEKNKKILLVCIDLEKVKNKTLESYRGEWWRDIE